MTLFHALFVSWLPPAAGTSKRYGVGGCEETDGMTRSLSFLGAARSVTGSRFQLATGLDHAPRGLRAETERDMPRGRTGSRSLSLLDAFDEDRSPTPISITAGSCPAWPRVSRQDPRYRPDGYAHCHARLRRHPAGGRRAEGAAVHAREGGKACARRLRCTTRRTPRTPPPCFTSPVSGKPLAWAAPKRSSSRPGGHPGSASIRVQQEEAASGGRSCSPATSGGGAGP